MTRNSPEFDQRIADWLERDPNLAPADVLSTVVAALPSIPQARRGLLAPRRFTKMSYSMRLAATVAVLAIVGAGAIYIGAGMGPGDPTPPPPAVTANPTASPTLGPSPAATVPPLTQTFTSTRYGYSVRYPADWTAEPAPELIDPGRFAEGEEGDWLDQLAPNTTDGLFRMASVPVPAGEIAAEWIARHYLVCAGSCFEGLTEVTVDGQPALLRSDNPEREMILILGDRAYFATLFPGPNQGIRNVPELFDAILATIDLLPEDAEAQPSPSGT